MKQKICNKLPVLLSIVTLVSLTLETNNAWGNNRQAPGLSIARFALPSISPHVDEVIPTGTSVGLKVAETKQMIQGLESETLSTIQMTRELYEKVIFEVTQYYKTIGTIEAKLQLGTTPENPQLVELRNKALQQLTQITATIETINGLSQGLFTFSQQTKTINFHITQSLTLPGAVDEDHAQLILMSQALGQLDGEIRQILNIMVANIGRQGQWVGAERIHFESLSVAIERGHFIIQPQATLIAEDVVISRPIAEPKPHKSHKKASHGHKKPSESPPLSQEHPLPKKLLPQPLTGQSPKSLPNIAVESRPKIQPLAQEDHTPSSPTHPEPKNEMIEYTTIAKGRAPLGILNAGQDPQSQKWYLFSSAKRGLGNPSDVIDIVSIVDKATSSKKGDEIKDTLIQLGLKPTQLRVIYATGSAEQAGKVYIFGK